MVYECLVQFRDADGRCVDVGGLGNGRCILVSEETGDAEFDLSAAQRLVLALVEAFGPGVLDAGRQFEAVPYFEAKPYPSILARGTSGSRDPEVHGGRSGA